MEDDQTIIKQTISTKPLIFKDNHLHSRIIEI